MRAVSAYDFNAFPEQPSTPAHFTVLTILYKLKRQMSCQVVDSDTVTNLV